MQPSCVHVKRDLSLSLSCSHWNRTTVCLDAFRLSITALNATELDVWVFISCCRHMLWITALQLRFIFKTCVHLFVLCLLGDSCRIKCRERNCLFVRLVFGNALHMNLFLFEFPIFLLYNLRLDSQGADLYSRVVPRSLRRLRPGPPYTVYCICI